MKYMKHLLATLLIAVLLTTTGCFGSFGLTNKVYDFNKSVGKEPVQTILMWALFIVPVYEVAGVLDLFILNTLEYWTGSNPVAGLENKSIELANGQVLKFQKEGKELVLNTDYGKYTLNFLGDAACTLKKDGNFIQSYEVTSDNKLIKHNDHESVILN